MRSSGINGVRRAKSLSWGVLHLGIAFSIGCLLNGSLAMARTIALVEPVVYTVVPCVFDRWWTAREASWRERAQTSACTGAGQASAVLPAT